MKGRKMKRRLLACISIIVVFMTYSVSVFAAPKTMGDGNIFDAEYYAANNPDVVNALGKDEAVLYNHYITFGKNEGRLPYANYIAGNLTANSGLKEQVTGKQLTLQLTYGKRTGTYVGTLENGIPEGTGAFATTDVNKQAIVYTGTWSKGHMKGQGKMDWVGASLSGSFTDDYNGSGIYTYASGASYYANLVNGKIVLGEAVNSNTNYAIASAPSVATNKSTSNVNSVPNTTVKAQGNTVYVTPKGKRYHRSAACAGKNAMATDLSSAQASGRTPCQKCYY